VQGFVQLKAESPHGTVWVRLAHVTAVGTVHYRSGAGEESHFVHVLAGGEWFSDPVTHPTEAAAKARAKEIAGSPAIRPWRVRLRDAVVTLTRRRDPDG
jgi:hypothetical protein